MKKILALLLLIILLTQNISGVVFASPTNEYPIERAELLKTLGVMTSLPSNYDAYVSRAEFVMLVARLLNVNEYSTAEKRYFIDVPMDHWATSAINSLVELEIISGSGDGYFYPDNTITVQEAVKMLACALGYKPYAEANQGYPYGYMNFAMEYGIISRKSNLDMLTYANVVDIIYNSLDIEVLQNMGNFLDAKKYNTLSEKTLLAIYHNIYASKGTVNAVDGISLNSDYVAKIGEININGEIFTFNGDPFAYIGKNVTMYYEKEENEKSNAVFLLIDKKNNVLEIDAEDFSNFDSTKNKVTYFTDNEYKMSLEVISGISVLKNGAVVSGDVENIVNGVNKGVYTFIDNNNDDVYETLLISEYKNIVVNYVDKVLERIYDKYDYKNFVSYKESTRSKVLFYKDGQQVPATEVSEGNVLTVYESEVYIRIYINTGSISGTVSQLEDDGNYKSVNIDGAWYDVDKDFETHSGVSISLGTYGVFYTDYFGKIANFGSEKGTVGYNLGYLIDVATKPGLDEKVLLKLFVPQEGIKIYPMADIVRIDGNRVEERALKESLLLKFNSRKSGYIICFEESDGIIKSIDTPYYDYTSENTDTIKLSQSVEDVKYRQRKFGKTIITNSDTIIFGVPVDSELQNASELDFSTPSADSISISRNYAVDSYKFDLESGFDNVVVVKGYISSSPTTELVVVNNISLAMDGYEDKECLSYYKDGALSQLYVASGKSMRDDGIKQGDTIRIGIDARGDISNWSVIFSYRADATAADVNEVNYGSEFNTTDRVIFGHVSALNNGVLKLCRDKNNPDVIDEVFDISGVQLTIYDSSITNTKSCIYSGTYEDVSAFYSTGTYSMAIVRTNLAKVEDVIIYK